MITYELPQPNDNTEVVTDKNGDTWSRDSYPTRRFTFWYGPASEIYTWSQLLIERGPLTEKEVK